jgi:hypothetical protein
MTAKTAKQVNKPVKQPRARLAAGRKKPATTAKAPSANLVSLELAYRTTNATLEVLGKAHGITKGRVSQLASEFGWERGDLQGRVRGRADAKVAEKEARDAEVEAGTEAAVEASAVVMANTILRERKDVARMMDVVGSLLGELEVQSAKAKAKPGEPAGEVGIKVEPLAVRIDNTRKLVETAKTLITLERHVLNISPDTPIDPAKRVKEAVDNGFAGLKAAFNKKLGRA